jgi:hypothetical protein
MFSVLGNQMSPSSGISFSARPRRADARRAHARLENGATRWRSLIRGSTRDRRAKPRRPGLIAARAHASWRNQRHAHGNPRQVQQLTSAARRWRRAPGHDAFRNDHKKETVSRRSLSVQSSEIRDLGGRKSRFRPALAVGDEAHPGKAGNHHDPGRGFGRAGSDDRRRG